MNRAFLLALLFSLSLAACDSQPDDFPFDDYQSMQTHLGELMELRRLHAAAALLEEALPRFPDQLEANVFNLAYVCGQLGNRTRGLNGFKYAFDHGIWFNIYGFQSPYYDTYREMDAFQEILARNDSLRLAAQATAGSHWPATRLVTLLAEAAGSVGVVGGQVADLASIGSTNMDCIGWIHLHKTADLFRAAVCIGGVAGNATPEQFAGLETYGRDLGLAFQIADDLLDAGTPAEATQGDGVRAEETSVLAAHSPAEARTLAVTHIERARAALDVLPATHRQPLESIAAYVVERTS